MRHNGFTLIEILLVVTVVGFILAIGLPKLTEMRRGMLLDAAAQQLAGDLRRVQVEAIKRNRSLRLRRTSAVGYAMDSIGFSTLPTDVTFGTGSADSIRMASFGPPISGGVAFPLSL